MSVSVLRAILLPAFISLTIVAPAAAQTSCYVDADAPGPTHNGLTWATAFLNPQDARAVGDATTRVRFSGGPTTATFGRRFQACGDSCPRAEGAEPCGQSPTPILCRRRIQEPAGRRGLRQFKYLRRARPRDGFATAAAKTEECIDET